MMTDLAKLAESLTPCSGGGAHYRWIHYFCKDNDHAQGCPAFKRPAILSALTLAYAAGVAEGLEMAAKWHDAEERRYQVSVGRATRNVRVAFQGKAQAHLRSAVKLRALKPPSKESTP